MIDPLSLVGLILTMVQLIAKEAETARQNKKKCLDLAERARTLANVLPSYGYPAVKDEDTERVLRRLKEALDETLTLIQSCQTVSICSRNRKAAELDGVNGKINDCIRDLNFIRNARTNQVAAASSVPAQTYDHGSYNQYQAQAGGGASSSACVGYPRLSTHPSMFTGLRLRLPTMLPQPPRPRVTIYLPFTHFQPSTRSLTVCVMDFASARSLHLE